MNIGIPENILNLLSVSVIISAVVMVIIQKFKHFSFITKKYQVGLLNFLFSFLFGIPFTMYFYHYSLIEACWVSLFSIIEAPSIYDILKKQDIINYTPKSLDDEIIEISRDEL